MGEVVDGLVQAMSDRPGLANILRKFSAQLEGGYEGAEKNAQYANQTFNRFAADRLKIKTKEGNLASFNLNRIQRRYLLIKRKTIRDGKRPRYLLLKYRRGGFTTLEQGLSYHQVATKRYQSVMTMAHTENATKKIYEISEMFYEMDPYAPKKKKSNMRMLDFKDNGSQFYFGHAGGDSMGRGDTMQRFHGSEVAWWLRGQNKIEKQREIMSGISEATSHGEIVLETTPNGKEWFHDAYMDAKKGINDYTPIFIPWFMDETNFLDVGAEACQEIFDTLTESEKQLILNARSQFRVELTCEHIAWRRQKQNDPAVGRLFAQEYPEDDETCWLDTGTPYFDQDQLIGIIERTPDYYREHVTGGGYRIEWKQPKYGEKFIIGADTSEGLKGRDPNGLGVLRENPLEQVAACHGLFKPAKLAKLCAEYSKKYNNALVVIERNNHGHAVLLALKNLGFPDHLVYEFKKGRKGWDTNAESRVQMLEAVYEAIQDESENAYNWIHDRDFLGECRSFGLQANGKYEHPPGGHDDTIFKWGIALRVHQLGGRRGVVVDSFKTS